MSALDKLFGKQQSEEQNKNPLGALGGLLSSVIPPSALEEMTTNIKSMVEYFKRNTDISVAQGRLIIEQNRLIMKHLGIEHDGQLNGDGNGRTGNGDAPN